MSSGPILVNNPVTNEPVALWRPACCAFGLFYTFYGARGIVDPLAGKPETAFYRPLAGRNLSEGIVIFTFIATGQRRPLGTVLCSLTVAALTDLYLVLTSPGVSGQVLLLHVFKTLALPIAGTKLLDLW